MEDFFVVDIPVFIPIYDANTKYGWSRHKESLWDLLKEVTGGYCMYCYDSVWINEQRRGQIEHGIEKINSPEYLTDCIPNLGLACSNCNGSYKKRGENSRKLPISSIKKFEDNDCKKYDCRGLCDGYYQLRMEYIRSGKIILQPFEAKIHKNGHTLRLQYDLLNFKYIPAKNRDAYEKEELEIMQNHIALFGLNSPERKNYEVGKYCKNVVDYRSLMENVTYNNLVVHLLREKLKCLDITKAIKICEIIYDHAWLRQTT